MAYHKITKRILSFRKQDIDYAVKASNDCFGADAFLKSRKRQNVFARQAISVYLRDLGFAYTDIAEFLGFDHTNIIYLYGKHSDDIKYTPSYREAFNKFVDMVGKNQISGNEPLYCYSQPFNYFGIKKIIKN